MKVVEKIDALDAYEVKKAFEALVSNYLTPAFGSISKRDFDILLFMKFQELGIIEKNPEVYELVSDLRVTRAKARNLLYEAKLRASTEQDLDDELKELLQRPLFFKENERIGIEIENPYLIDHVRYKLKKQNHITDSSFSPELVKLTKEGYICLFENYLSEVEKAEISQALVRIGITEDTSFSGIMKAILKKIGTKVADDAGGEIANKVGEYLTPIISGSIDNAVNALSSLFSDYNQ